ncbi:hypothetical protein CRE_10190 [Caenorhabditis remanei]|uniref:Uncharacterized protein n=1 Tax=Caenorhabditis remanei TaxID=31234 RepID=E3M6T6_CAERE|nr:hypothetical protein CRE_10190 [Caenorhabditis remanei]
MFLSEKHAVAGRSLLRWVGGASCRDTSAAC